MSLPVCYMLLPKYQAKVIEPSKYVKELEHLRASEQPGGEERKAIKPWHLLKIPRTMLMGLVILITGVFWAFLGANLEEHLSPVRITLFQNQAPQLLFLCSVLPHFQLELTKTETTLMFILTAVWYGITCPVSGWIADKIPKTWPMISIGLLGTAVVCPLLGPVPIFGLEK